MEFTSILQSIAGGVQALSNASDALINAHNQKSKETEARLTAKHTYSGMLRKVIELDQVKEDVVKEFQIYWFPKKQFVSWSRKVDAITPELQELVRNCATADNLASWVSLSKMIELMCTKIDRITTQGTELVDVLRQRETRRIVQVSTSIDITKISALQSKLELILKKLTEGSIDAIRLYGEVGTGKRAIIEHLNNHEAIVNMFDIVLLVPPLDFENANRNSSLEEARTHTHIQRIICRRLGLNIGGSDDMHTISSKINKELHGVKYLLLLDDVKGDIKLETIGLPSNSNGSKIVFSTNFPYVRPFHPFFPIQTARLGPGDSWQVFEEIFNGVKDRLQENVAIQVVKWCDGLFSLIKIVAQNFKSRNSEQSWRDGLSKLRNPAESGQYYWQVLENFLHFSYDGLENNQKSCFLFCALYPENSKIPVDCLFDCWAAHNLLEYGNAKKVHMSWKEILEYLLAMGLLKEGQDKQYVTMDKVFREAALMILQQHGQLKCLIAKEAREKFEENRCDDIHWISLADCELEDLPTKVMCSKLTTLFLQNNSKLENFPSTFFDHMEKLVVLDLYRTGIQSLPPTCNLKSLKVLYANGCKTSNVLPFKIEGAENLEVVDIRGTMIKKIPDYIKNLKHLRRLMISIFTGYHVDHLKISELPSLKELIIGVKSGGDRLFRNELIADMIKKIDNIKDLTMLEFRFREDIVDVIQEMGDTLKILVPEKDSLEHILHGRRVVQYNTVQVRIGLPLARNYEIPKSFRYFDSYILSCDGIGDVSKIKNVVAKINAFILIEDEALEHLHDVGTLGSGINHIEGCLVHRCRKIETLMLIGCFSRLRTLVLVECSRLKVLFSVEVVQQVMAVEHLELRDCAAIEEINMLSTDGGVNGFPNLKNIILYNLRSLRKICSIEWSLQTTLQIHECPNLTEVPLDTISANNLCKIIVQKTWWETLQLGYGIKQKFENYCEFS